MHSPFYKGVGGGAQRALRLKKTDYTSPASQSSIQTQNKPKVKQKKRAGDCLDFQYQVFKDLQQPMEIAEP